MLLLDRAAPTAAHWAEDAYRDVFSPGVAARIAIVLEDQNRGLSGFVIARVAAGECELENIVVAESMQRRGAGTQLLRCLAAAVEEGRARGIFLEVRESNGAARALYERCGFRIAGLRPSYYADPAEDAVLYSLEL
jgi:[ribosomal protein S18]-alanine N-acetyltransferase